MFTGLVAGMGEVVALNIKPGGASLTIKPAVPDAIDGAATGDSIAISGACLTVTEIKGKELSFDLSLETLRSTTLEALRPGDRVNLEPSLRAGGKLGGHFVSGHVDGVGRIKNKTKHGDAAKFEISAPPEVMTYLVEKGSVAVDGISLTVVDVLRDSFTVVIIPHTEKVTTIGLKGPGNAVNLEADIIGKYVHKFLRGRDSKEDGFLKTLKSEGFI